MAAGPTDNRAPAAVLTSRLRVPAARSAEVTSVAIAVVPHSEAPPNQSPQTVWLDLPIALPATVECVTVNKALMNSFN